MRLEGADAPNLVIPHHVSIVTHLPSLVERVLLSLVEWRRHKEWTPIVLVVNVPDAVAAAPTAQASLVKSLSAAVLLHVVIFT